MDNELVLYDRINAIKDTVNRYGMDNFYLSFSGGKDSTVLHYLLDIALPGNDIPRLFMNTGMEYLALVKYVKELAAADQRIIVYNSGVNIKDMLNTYGWPFKSKEHSTKLHSYQLGLKTGVQKKSTILYMTPDGGTFNCPKKLLYQFTEEFKLPISGYCCNRLKKDTAKRYIKNSGRKIVITGMQRQEGGQRSHMGCTVFKSGKLVKFHPLSKVSDEWENWFIDKYNIRLCELYYEPYNFERTGCKGCPFALKLQEQLDKMEELLPNEARQCEIIWKPVYEEYRRIGYKLRRKEK